MSERAPSAPTTYDPNQLPLDQQGHEGQVALADPVSADQLEFSFDALAVPEPAPAAAHIPTPRTESNPADAPTVVDTAPKPIVHATARRVGTRVPETVPAPGPMAESPVAETARKQGRAARLSRIALRMTGLTSAAKYTKESVNSVRMSTNEIRAGNNRYKAMQSDKRAERAAAKVLDAQHKEATKLNREFDLRGQTGEYVAAANSGQQNTLQSEFSLGRADIAEMRADRKSRQAQKLAGKVLKAQMKEARHLNRAYDRRARAQLLDERAEYLDRKY